MLHFNGLIPKYIRVVKTEKYKNKCLHEAITKKEYKQLFPTTPLVKVKGKTFMIAMVPA